MRAFELYEFKTSEVEKIFSIFDRVWKTKYPDIKVYKNVDTGSDLYGGLSFYTDPEMKSTYGKSGEFELDMNVEFGVTVDLNDDKRKPFTLLLVGHAYAGNYRGIITKFFEELYRAGPHSKYRELEIGNRGDSGQWSSIAKKLGAHMYSSSKYGIGDTEDYTGMDEE